MQLSYIQRGFFKWPIDVSILSVKTVSLTGSTLLWLVIITLGVAFTVSLLIILLLKRKCQQKIIELEHRFLLVHMDPHFIFNSLTAIQNYIFKNDPYQATRYFSSFSKLVRLILENSQKDFTAIAHEVETLTLYLELQKLRFGDKFEFSITVDPDIDAEHHTIPPMLAQPFIENAIERGTVHMGKRGFIIIRFNLSGSNILFEVEDNGGEYPTSNANQLKLKKEFEAHAYRISKDRLLNLGKIFHRKYKVEIKDLAQVADKGRQGTLIRFTLPIH